MESHPARVGQIPGIAGCGLLERRSRHRTSRIVEMDRPRAKRCATALKIGCCLPRRAEHGHPTRSAAPAAALLAPEHAHHRSHLREMASTRRAEQQLQQHAHLGHRPQGTLHVTRHQLAQVTTGRERHVTCTPVNVLVRLEAGDHVARRLPGSERPAQHAPEWRAPRRVRSARISGAAATGRADRHIGARSAASMPLW